MSKAMNRREVIGHSARAVAGSYFLAEGVDLRSVVGHMRGRLA